MSKLFQKAVWDHQLLSVLMSLLISSFIRILLRLLRIHTQKNLTLATKRYREDECLWEINLFVTSIDKLDVNITVNVEGEWFINEDLDLAYFSAFASDLCHQILALIWTVILDQQ